MKWISKFINWTKAILAVLISFFFEISFTSDFLIWTLAKCLLLFFHHKGLLGSSLLDLWMLAIWWLTILHWLALHLTWFEQFYLYFSTSAWIQLNLKLFKLRKLLCRTPGVFGWYLYCLEFVFQLDLDKNLKQSYQTPTKLMLLLLFYW